eukprot:COSAG02_NODE_24618_length_682_cov_1.245283_1_plen_125_part_10
MPNAVEVVDESKDEDAADAKKKAKNKKQAERRKAAMALLRAQEEKNKIEESETPTPPPNAPSPAPSPEIVFGSKPPSNFSPGSMTAEQLMQTSKYLIANGMIHNANASRAYIDFLLLFAYSFVMF